MPRPGAWYRGWILVWALGVTTIVSYGTTQYLFQLLVVPIQHDLGWNRALISGAFSGGIVVAGVAGLPVGALVDRRGARALMSLGSLLGGGGLIALSRISEPWQLYALWSGVLGVAMALTFYPVTFTVMTNWFVRRRGSALAILTLLGGLASPIFIPLAGLLIPHLGWRDTLVVCGLAQLAIALPLHAFVLRRRPEDLNLLPDGLPPAGAPPPRPGGAGLREAAAALPFWTLTLASSLNLLANGVLLAHQVAYLIGRGFDPVLAATAAGLVGLASLPGRYLINRLSERAAPQTLLALCSLGQATGTALLALALSPVLVWAYVAVYGAAFGAISPLRASTMAEQFGRRAYGAITAVQGVPVALAAALGPVAAGLLYDRFGSYELALWLTVAAFAAAAGAVAVTPRPPVPAPATPSSAPGPARTVP